MKRLFLVLGLVVILTIVAFAIPQAGKKRLRILHRIENKTRLAETLINEYFKGYFEIDGIRFYYTVEQKDSMKVEYNKVIQWMADSIPVLCDSLFAP